MRVLINRLLKSTGTPVKAAAIVRFTTTVEKHCKWLIEAGELSGRAWRQVGQELRAAKCEEGILRLWFLIDTALRAEDQRVAELLDEGVELMEDISGQSQRGSEGEEEEEKARDLDGRESRKQSFYPVFLSAPPYEPPDESPGGKARGCYLATGSASDFKPVTLGRGKGRPPRFQPVEEGDDLSDVETTTQRGHFRPLREKMDPCRQPDLSPTGEPIIIHSRSFQ